MIRERLSPQRKPRSGQVQFITPVITVLSVANWILSFRCKQRKRDQPIKDRVRLGLYIAVRLTQACNDHDIFFAQNINYLHRTTVFGLHNMNLTLFLVGLYSFDNRCSMSFGYYALAGTIR